MSKQTFTAAFGFGGGGGGARGFQIASARLYGNQSGYRILGGFDIDPYACNAFHYLTGVEQSQMDVLTMTPEDLRSAWGEEAPDTGFNSAPCVGASKLLPSAKAATAHYITMNSLAVRFTRLMLDTYKHRPPPLLIYENVPNITARASAVVQEIRDLLTAAGYAIQDGYHECREVGDLAQYRRRWFFVARHKGQLPAFLYKPPRRRGKVCGDVLGPMPLPCDGRGGRMHALPQTSFLNLLRLWAIPAGGDWRDLPGVVAEGKKRRDVFRRHLVQRWDQPAGTIGGSGSNGPCAVEDRRVAGDGAPDLAAHGFRGAWGVLDPAQPASTVTGNGRVATGPFSYADGRIGLAPNRPCFPAGYGVLSPDQASRAIAGTSEVGCGAYALADARIDLIPQRGNGGLHYNKYHVVPWDGPAKTVTGATRVGSGALCAADIRVNCTPRAGAYGVVPYDQPSRTIPAHGAIDNSAVSVAVPVPGDLPEDYVVLDYETTRAIVEGRIPLPFAVVDPARPGEPLCVVDSLQRPPYRPVAVQRGKRLVRERRPVTLVLISADGTWHRPLTTLELAVLQGLDWTHGDAPLDFGGGSTKARELIGNMVPPPAAAAIAEQMLLTLTASRLGLWFLDQGGAGVWVRPEFARELLDDGVVQLGDDEVLRLGSAAAVEEHTSHEALMEAMPC